MFGCDGCIHNYSPKKKNWGDYGGLFSPSCDNCRNKWTPVEVKTKDSRIRYYTISENDKRWEVDGWSLEEVENKIKELEKSLKKPEDLLILSDNGYVSK